MDPRLPDRLVRGHVRLQLLIFSAPLPKITDSYWFLMQLSMILGFLTAFPVNRWLVNSAVEEAM